MSIINRQFFLTVDKNHKRPESIVICFQCQRSSFFDKMVYYDGSYFHTGDCLIKYKQSIKDNKERLKQILAKLNAGPVLPEELFNIMNDVFPKTQDDDE